MESFKKSPINQAFKDNGNNELLLGNVSVKNIGKASLQLSDNELIIKSLNTANVFRQPIEKIDYLAYSTGNFFIDEKIFMGINGEQFEISCKEDESKFKNFFDTVKSSKDSNLKNRNNTLTNSKTETAIDDNEFNENDDNSGNDTSAEIRNFYNLMKDGIISEEEFEEKKKELLKS